MGDMRKPKIRFKGYTEEWNLRMFKDIFTVSQGLQIPISKRFVEDGPNRYFYITNEFLKENNTERYYIENPSQNVICDEEDILMTRTGNTGMIVTDVKGCYHNNFFKINYDKVNYDKKFICNLLTTVNMQNNILKNAGSSTIPDLSHKSFYKLDGLFPEYNEQRKISEYLICVTNLIVLHQNKIDKLKRLKKIFLDKMFPKDGRKTPEIRFGGFTEDWEQRKLGDVAEEFKSGTFIASADIQECGEYPVYGGNGLRGYSNVYNHEGEFALIGRQGALCGNMNFSSGKAYFTEHAVCVRANNTSNTRFLYYLLDKMNLGRFSDQSAQPGLAVGKLLKLENLFPIKQEQIRIGEFFLEIDNLITLHQCKLDKLKKLKKSFLEKMFI